MRTKTLVLTAAISAAALATSMAQIFSVNAVGYVKMTIPAGKLAIIANPLNGTDNNLDTILPLALDGSQDGVTIFRFDGTGYGLGAIQWFGALASWIDPDPNQPAHKTIAPGEGFWIYNITANPVDLTFVGEVPQGNLSNPIPGNLALSMRSSQVPQSAPLGDATTAFVNPTLLFPAVVGDTIFQFDVPSQTYVDPAPQYLGVAGLEWVNAPDNEGPVIPVGTGFFVVKFGPAGPQNWTRTFSVN